MKATCENCGYLVKESSERKLINTIRKAGGFATNAKSQGIKFTMANCPTCDYRMIIKEETK